MELEIKRQTIHALGVFTILLIQIFEKWYGALIMLLISIIFLILGEYRKNKEKYKLLKIKPLDEFEDILEDEFKTYERKKELPFNGAIMFYLGCFIVTVLFQPYIAIASITVLALSDSLSTLIGHFLGKHKLFINKKKSWEGSIIFFVTTFMILLFFVYPIKALIIAILVTFIEMLPKVDDNLTIPITTGFLIWLI